jgi:hypothetical protein
VGKTKKWAKPRSGQNQEVGKTKIRGASHPKWPAKNEGAGFA